MNSRKSVGLLSILLAGCAMNSGVVPMGSDTYMVSRQAATGFTGMGTLKAEAMQEAYVKCQETGKSVQVLGIIDAQPPYILGNFPKTEIRFKCVTEAPTSQSNVGGASGTGFLVDGHGTVITSNHVVQGATRITVRCGKGAPVLATVSSNNQSIDIAVLSSGTPSSSYLSLAAARTATVGQRIFTFGFPVTELLGGEPKFTDGTISALSGIGGEQTYLQISIPVQPGNSGGPVVTEKGEVVGVVAAAVAIAPFLKNTGTPPQNINWAVKAEYAALMVDAPPKQPAAASREAAIKHVAESLCFIEAH